MSTKSLRLFRVERVFAEGEADVDAKFLLPHRLDGLKGGNRRPGGELEGGKSNASGETGLRQQTPRLRRVMRGRDCGRSVFTNP